LILPFQYDEFLKYGEVPSEKFPVFFDAPAEDLWDPATQPCKQEYYDDFTGTDSLASFFAAVFVFLSVQAIENCRGGRALFDFRGLQGYHKDTEGDDYEDAKMDKGVPLDDTGHLEETSKTAPMVLTGMDESGASKAEMAVTDMAMEDESEAEHEA
jgi:hypothetical protein